MTDDKSYLAATLTDTVCFLPDLKVSVISTFCPVARCSLGPIIIKSLPPGSNRIWPERGRQDVAERSRVDGSANQPESGSKADAAGPKGTEEPWLFSRGRRDHRPKRRNRWRLAPVAPDGERVCPGKPPVCGETVGAVVESHARGGQAVANAPTDSSAGGSFG